MQTTIETSLVTEKTKELCQAILDQPNLRAARQNIERFMADSIARAQYEGVVSKGQELEQKQRSAQTLSAAEISAFEQARESLMQNPVARGFIDAQEEFHHVQEDINKFVSKTLELGRLPNDGDFEAESCGSGCGCGHNH